MDWVRTQQIRDILWDEWKRFGMTEFAKETGLTARRCYAIFKEEGPETEFTHDKVADRIFTGLGRPDLYYELERCDRYTLSPKSKRTTAHNAAQRLYYEKNKERIKARHREYWHRVVKPKRESRAKERDKVSA